MVVNCLVDTVILFLYFFFSYHPTRFYAQYNEMPPSPLSNADKLAESSRREEELRREKDHRDREDGAKAYHERDPRVPMTSQQRKG